MKISEAAFTIVDVESTGLDPAVDRVVEVGMLRIEPGCIGDIGISSEYFTSLVQPDMPVPCTASAVHNIVDEELTGAPRLADIAEQIRCFAEYSVLVAHNAPFDRAFLPMLGDGDGGWLCSERLAKHTFPEAPAYKNSVLFYFFGGRMHGIDLAHRALPDCRITAFNFNQFIARYFEQGHPDSVEALLAYAARPIIVTTMPFGKHRDESVFDLPADYVAWLFKNIDDMDPDLRYTLLLAAEAKASPALPLFGAA